MKKGFTLIEVLSVVFLLGLMALFLLPNLFQGRLLLNRAQRAGQDFQAEKNIIEEIKNNGRQGRAYLEGISTDYEIQLEEEEKAYVKELRVQIEGREGREKTWFIYFKK